MTATNRSAGSNDTSRDLDPVLACASMDTHMLLKQLFDREQRAAAMESRLAFALDAGSAGVWDWDLLTNGVWFSDVWQTMLVH